MPEFTLQPVAYRILDDGTRLPIFETEPGKQFYIDEHGQRHDGLFHVDRDEWEASFAPHPDVIVSDEEF